MKQSVYNKLLSILRSKGYDVLRKTPEYISFSSAGGKEIKMPTNIKFKDIPNILKRNGIIEDY